MFFHKDGISITQPTKIDMPLIKETKKTNKQRETKYTNEIHNNEKKRQLLYVEIEPVTER